MMHLRQRLLCEPSSALFNFATSFWSDRRGVTAVEFAFVGPLFFGLLGATLDIGFEYVLEAQLQATAENVARRFKTNADAWKKLTYQEFIDDRVCTWQKYNDVYAPGVVRTGTLWRYFDCSKVILDIQAGSIWSWGASWIINNNKKTDYVKMPVPGEVVVVKVAYRRDRFFNFLPDRGGRFVNAVGFDGPNNFLQGSAAARVESR